jgi:hypothetical protein
VEPPAAGTARSATSGGALGRGWQSDTVKPQRRTNQKQRRFSMTTIIRSSRLRPRGGDHIALTRWRRGCAIRCRCEHELNNVRPRARRKQPQHHCASLQLPVLVMELRGRPARVASVTIHRTSVAPLAPMGRFELAAVPPSVVGDSLNSHIVWQHSHDVELRRSAQSD